MYFFKIILVNKFFLGQQIDQILEKYYSKERIEENKNYVLKYYIAPAYKRVPGEYLIELRDDYKHENDKNAFKQMIEIFDAKISQAYIAWYSVKFKNDDLDKENLNKLFL